MDIAELLQDGWGEFCELLHAVIRKSKEAKEYFLGESEKAPRRIDSTPKPKFLSPEVDRNLTALFITLMTPESADISTLPYSPYLLNNSTLPYSPLHIHCAEKTATVDETTDLQVVLNDTAAPQQQQHSRWTALYEDHTAFMTVVFLIMISFLFVAPFDKRPNTTARPKKSKETQVFVSAQSAAHPKIALSEEPEILALVSQLGAVKHDFAGRVKSADGESRPGFGRHNTNTAVTVADEVAGFLADSEVPWNIMVQREEKSGHEGLTSLYEKFRRLKNNSLQTAELNHHPVMVDLSKKVAGFEKNLEVATEASEQLKATLNALKTEHAQKQTLDEEKATETADSINGLDHLYSSLLETVKKFRTGFVTSVDLINHAEIRNIHVKLNYNLKVARAKASDDRVQGLEQKISDAAVKADQSYRGFKKSVVDQISWININALLECKKETREYLEGPEFGKALRAAIAKYSAKWKKAVDVEIDKHIKSIESRVNDKAMPLTLKSGGTLANEKRQNTDTQMANVLERLTKLETDNKRLSQLEADYKRLSAVEDENKSLRLEIERRDEASRTAMKSIEGLQTAPSNLQKCVQIDEGTQTALTIHHRSAASTDQQKSQPVSSRLGDSSEAFRAALKKGKSTQQQARVDPSCKPPTEPKKKGDDSDEDDSGRPSSLGGATAARRSGNTAKSVANDQSVSSTSQSQPSKQSKTADNKGTVVGASNLASIASATAPVAASSNGSKVALAPLKAGLPSFSSEAKPRFHMSPPPKPALSMHFNAEAFDRQDFQFGVPEPAGSKDASTSPKSGPNLVNPKDKSTPQAPKSADRAEIIPAEPFIFPLSSTTEDAAKKPAPSQSSPPAAPIQTLLPRSSSATGQIGLVVNKSEEHGEAVEVAAPNPSPGQAANHKTPNSKSSPGANLASSIFKKAKAGKFKPPTKDSSFGNAETSVGGSSATSVHAHGENTKATTQDALDASPIVEVQTGNPGTTSANTDMAAGSASTSSIPALIASQAAMVSEQHKTVKEDAAEDSSDRTFTPNAPAAFVTPSSVPPAILVANTASPVTSQSSVLPTAPAMMASNSSSSTQWDLRNFNSKPSELPMPSLTSAVIGRGNAENVLMTDVMQEESSNEVVAEAENMVIDEDDKNSLFDSDNEDMDIVPKEDSEGDLEMDLEGSPADDGDDQSATVSKPQPHTYQNVDMMEGHVPVANITEPAILAPLASPFIHGMNRDGLSNNHPTQPPSLPTLPRYEPIKASSSSLLVPSASANVTSKPPSLLPNNDGERRKPTNLSPLWQSHVPQQSPEDRPDSQQATLPLFTVHELVPVDIEGVAFVSSRQKQLEAIFKVLEQANKSSKKPLPNAAVIEMARDREAQYPALRKPGQPPKPHPEALYLQRVGEEIQLIQQKGSNFTPFTLSKYQDAKFVVEPVAISGDMKKEIPDSIKTQTPLPPRLSPRVAQHPALALGLRQSQLNALYTAYAHTNDVRLKNGHHVLSPDELIDLAVKEEFKLQNDAITNAGNSDPASAHTQSDYVARVDSELDMVKQFTTSRWWGYTVAEFESDYHTEQVPAHVDLQPDPNDGFEILKLRQNRLNAFHEVLKAANEAHPRNGKPAFGEQEIVGLALILENRELVTGFGDNRRVRSTGEYIDRVQSEIHEMRHCSAARWMSVISTYDFQRDSLVKMTLKRAVRERDEVADARRRRSREESESSSSNSVPTQLDEEDDDRRRKPPAASNAAQSGSMGAVPVERKVLPLKRRTRPADSGT